MANVYAKNVFQSPDGSFQYEILQDGVRSIHQDFHPDLEGLTPMDEATANECADVVLARLAAADA